MLEHPEIPLHNNSAELGARAKAHSRVSASQIKTGGNVAFRLLPGNLKRIHSSLVNTIPKSLVPDQLLCIFFLSA